MAERPSATKRRDPAADDDELVVEEPTGEHQASRDFVREVARTGLWKTSWALICTAAALIGGTLWAYRAAAAEAHDAGVQAAVEVKRQVDEQGEQLKRMQADFTSHVQIEAEHRVRVEKKINALLNRFDVKDPAPTPKDAGLP